MLTPVSCAVAGWVMVVLLWRGSRAMGVAAEPDARLLRRLPRIAVSAALMGGVLLGVEWALGDALYADGLRYIALLALVASGIFSYFAAAHLTGALRLSELKSAMRRRNG